MQSRWTERRMLPSLNLSLDLKPVRNYSGGPRSACPHESCRNTFSPQMPAASLHWIIADKNEAIVVESMTDGLHVHDDPAGVLTNNPPFDLQMFHLNNYLGLSRASRKIIFLRSFRLPPTAAAWVLSVFRGSLFPVPLCPRGIHPRKLDLR